MSSSTIKKVSLYGISICVLASLFYVYDFIIRIIPGTIYNTLVHRYALNAADFGFLSSLFFLGYIVMQLPCGLLYDRFGPRVVMAVTLFIASVATYLFLATDSFIISATARFFMGIGSAFAYIGALVLVSRWLPNKYYALSAGIIQFMGSMGAIAGETPVARLVENYGPNPVIYGLAIIGVIIAVIFAIFIKNSPNNSKPLSQNQQATHILAPLRKTLLIPQNWATAFYGFCIWAPISIFAALWAVPYFRTSLNVTTPEAAFIASFLWVGVAVGGPTLGLISNITHSRCKPLALAAILGLIASIMIFYNPYLNILEAVILCFVFGFASSAQAVTFGLVHDNNCIQNIGTASGFNNMAIVFGGIIFQPIVGLILQWCAHSQLHHTGTGLHGFSNMDYSIALSVIPICYLLGLLTVIFLVKETNNNQKKL